MIAEMAMGVVLVIGAVLMVRSLWALQRIDLGFEPENVLTMKLMPPGFSYTPEQSVQLYQRLLERVRALPDVRKAGALRSLPLGNTIGDWGAEIEGYVETPGHAAKGDWQVLTAGASEAIGERLVRGRLFADADNSAQAQPVALINETMARMYWAGRDPIGGRFRVGHGQPSRPWFTVVGIVANERHNGVDVRVKEKFYITHAQWNMLGMNPIRAMTLVVKTGGDPLALAGPIRAIVRELDPNLPVANIRPMTDVVGTALATPRFTGWLLALFAMLALVLSAVGIYGVLAYLVSQRTHEIGIRLAMGAERPQVLRMVLGHGLALAMIGLFIGVGAAFFLTSLMAAQLHDIAPRDLTTFVGVPVLMTLVALAASYIPAWRATRVDPLIALRAQ